MTQSVAVVYSTDGIKLNLAINRIH